MNAKSKELIEELKGIVMDLHRSAGTLDAIIQNIDECILDEKDPEYMRVYILHQMNFRLCSRQSQGHINLDDKELDIWKRLNESLKEESQ